QRRLDRLIYRERRAREQFLQEAAEFLGQAQPPEAVAGFLTSHASVRLGLTCAWLAPLQAPIAATAAATMSGAPLGIGRVPAAPAPVEPLLQRLQSVAGPAILNRHDLSVSGSSFPVLFADEPALAAWYEAGARLLVPLHAGPGVGSTTGGNVVAVWALGSRRSSELPERDDLVALARVAQQASVLLDYARLNQEQVRQALVAQDLERARHIQQRLLPASIDGWPGRLEIAARLRPARETSGDFYDVFPLADVGERDGPPSRDGEPNEAHPLVPLQVAVGDVQGKGVGAALVMAVAQTALRSTAPIHGASPASTLSGAGGVLHRSVGRRDFVCCSLLVVEPPDPATGRAHVRLRVANAGQVPPLLCRAGQAQELIPGGEAFPLGILPAPDYRELAVDLTPGDVIVLATDGLPEAPDRESGQWAAGSHPLPRPRSRGNCSESSGYRPARATGRSAPGPPKTSPPVSGPI
ncbi:MAG: serine/threonine-protein phosphatase, partial [Chloroflexi bacterium]|nr:serine/threonine-protein phosphatase [Chloroflexota bacterium]